MTRRPRRAMDGLYSDTPARPISNAQLRLLTEGCQLNPLSTERRQLQMSARLIRALRASKAARNAGDWNAVLIITENNDDLLQEPRLISERIIAASELGISDLYKDAIDICKNINLTEAELAPVIRIMMRYGHFDSAWDLIVTRGNLTKNGVLTLYGRRILERTDDTILADEIRSCLRISDSYSTLTEYSESYLDPTLDKIEDLRPGTIAISPGPNVDLKHLHALEAMRDRLIAAYDHKERKFSIRVLNDVFVDFNGQIWYENGIIVRDKGRPIGTLAKNKVPNIFAATSLLIPKSGFYHWYIQTAPLLEAALRMYNDVSVLVKAEQNIFELDTIKLSNAQSLRYLAVTDAVFVSKLFCGPKIEFDDPVIPNELMSLYRRMRRNAVSEFNNDSIKSSDLVYISRGDATRRPMENETELERELHKRGFAILRMSELTLASQIMLTNEAIFILSPHGAGLSHLATATPGRNVVEILPIKSGAYRQRFNYARLALRFGHSYEAWLEPQYSDQWTTNLGSFLPFLDQKLELLGLRSPSTT